MALVALARRHRILLGCKDRQHERHLFRKHNNLVIACVVRVHLVRRAAVEQHPAFRDETRDPYIQPFHGRRVVRYLLLQPGLEVVPLGLKPTHLANFESPFQSCRLM